MLTKEKLSNKKAKKKEYKRSVKGLKVLERNR